MKKYIISLIVTLATLIPCHANLVSEADSAYMADDFVAAARLYRSAIDSLGPSAERYYNLGNAYYRNGQIGRAIVSYERALRLDPTNSDLADNLEFVNSKTVDRIEPEVSFIGNATDRFVVKLHPDTWAWFGMGTFVLALVGICVYFFSNGVTIRKVGFFGSGILVVFCVLANIFAYRGARKATADNQAIVTAPSVILSTTPRQPKDRSEEALLLHEGTKVTLLDSISSGQEKWYDVKVDAAHRAWIPADAVEVI